MPDKKMPTHQMYFINVYNQYFLSSLFIIFIFFVIFLFSLKDPNGINPITLLLLLLILLWINHTNLYDYDYLSYFINYYKKKLNLNVDSDKTNNFKYIAPLASMIFILILAILFAKFLNININPTKRDLVIFLLYLIIGVYMMISNINNITSKITEVENNVNTSNKSSDLSFILGMGLFILVILLGIAYACRSKIKDKDPRLTYSSLIFISFIYYLIVSNIAIARLNSSVFDISRKVIIFKNPQPNLFL